MERETPYIPCFVIYSLSYDFNHTAMNVRNLDGQIKAPVLILNSVFLTFRFHTFDAIKRSADRMTVCACAAPSPPKLST